MKETVLQALSNSETVLVLNALLKKNYCVNAISQELNMPKEIASKHIKALADAGILISENKNNFMHYRVNRVVLTELSSDLRELSQINEEKCDTEEINCPQDEKSPCDAKETQDCSSEQKNICHGHQS